jgi:hypothetical protein
VIIFNLRPNGRLRLQIIRHVTRACDDDTPLKIASGGSSSFLRGVLYSTVERRKLPSYDMALRLKVPDIPRRSYKSC